MVVGECHRAVPQAIRLLLMNLKLLDLGRNRISDVAPLSDLECLQDLYFDCNPRRKKSQTLLTALPSIRTLALTVKETRSLALCQA